MAAVPLASPSGTIVPFDQVRSTATVSHTGSEIGSQPPEKENTGFLPSSTPMVDVTFTFVGCAASGYRGKVKVWDALFPLPDVTSRAATVEEYGTAQSLQLTSASAGAGSY